MALVDEDNAPAAMRVNPDEFILIDSIYAIDEDAASSQAAHHFARATRGHDEEGSVFVGVMYYDEYMRWMSQKSDDAPDTLTILAFNLTWFEVECVFTVNYFAHEIRNW